jgi:serine/threonine-protein kinase
VIDEIGRGGMGVVWRAHDPRLRRDVALKFLSANQLLHPGARTRFIAEARAASALDHRHICTIYDVGTTDDQRLYIAMAYYARGTLSQRIANGPLPLDEAVDIALQVADALDCAHEAGIVHRDVKPANIAFAERGEAKVLDFGVAVLNDDVGGEFGLAGTPAYMAPEQLRGDAADRRADVWSLGVVLFEMLSGRRAFRGADRATVRHAIVHGEPLAATGHAACGRACHRAGVEEGSGGAPGRSLDAARADT